MTMFWRTTVGVIGLTVLTMGVVRAEEAQDTKNSAGIDCRYEQSDSGTNSAAFPSDDVFRPLMADPKQPQFFATYQSVQRREPTSTVTGVGKSVNVGSVGFGENFGFYSKRQGCNGWQVGLLAGVFSQFNLDAPSSDLINADYIVGIPLSWRHGAWSTRVRLYHQSSHVGDEFLLENPGFNRVNLSFEEVEAIVSYEYRWIRMYAGGGYLIHREPAQLDRHRVQWGMELRGPTVHSPFLGSMMPHAGAGGRFQDLRRAAMDHQLQCHWRVRVVQAWREASVSVPRELLSRLLPLWTILQREGRKYRIWILFGILGHSQKGPTGFVCLDPFSWGLPDQSMVKGRTGRRTVNPSGRILLLQQRESFIDGRTSLEERGILCVTGGHRWAARDTHCAG